MKFYPSFKVFLRWFVLKTALVLFISTIATQSLKAQEELIKELTNIVPPDVEVAKLGSFGTFKQNLATGQLDVNVPIRNLKGISLECPISISYNPTGIRVEERSTSIGQNWTLLGVGVITKTIVGQPDEQQGYYSSYIYSNLFRDGSYTPSNSASDKVFQTSQGRFDMEPDYFSFSFNGRGGKFYYDPATSQYYTMPYSKLAITKSTVADGGEFKIIDEKGFVYIFDKTTISSCSYGTIGGADFSYDYTSQWYLSKVYAPDGNLEFTFEYVQGPLINEQGSESQSINYLQSTNDCGVDLTPGIMPESRGSTSFNNVLRRNLFLSRVICPQEQASFYYKNQLSGALRLDSLSFSRNGAENENWRLFQNYYSNTNKLRLDSICQYMGQKRIGKYDFEYNSVPIPNTDSKAQDLWGYYNGEVNTSLVPKVWFNKQYIGKADRLLSFPNAEAGILKKIKYPTGGSSEFYYELNDYGSAGRSNSLENEPIKSYTSKSVSRRFAEVGAGTSTISFTLGQQEIITFNSYRDNCNNGTNDCSNDPTTVNISLEGPGGTITSLNGPVKKGTEIVLDLVPGSYTVRVLVNDVQEFGGVTFKIPTITGYKKKIEAGGLRIKKVVNYDPGTENTSIKKFEYTVKEEPTRSSGTILSKPNFIYTNTMSTRCAPGTIPSCGSSMNFIIITSNSTNNLYFSDGSPVFYTRVVEILGENGEGGSIEHRFSYESDGQIRAFPFPTPTSRSWKRGLPLQTTHISALGDTTYKEINEYYSDPRNFHKITGYKVGLSAYCPYYDSGIRVNVASTDYLSEWFYLKKNTKITYGLSGQSPVESTTEYFYDNEAHLQAGKVKKQLSNGNYSTSYMKYPLDYSVTASATDPAAKAIYKMQTKNMIEYPVEQTESVSSTSTETIKKSDLVVYNEFPSGGIYISKLYEFVSEIPLANTSLSTVSGNVFNFNSNYKLSFEAKQYNAKGKLVEFLNQAGLKKSVIYHSNGLLPIAFATNAGANQVYYNGFEELAPSGSTTSKYGRKSNNGIFAVPATSIAAGNYTKSWWERIGGNWVYNSAALVHNGSSAISFGTAGNLIDNLCIYPQDAELQTFDYDLGSGLISKVPGNGNGVQFEYDPMLRLKQVSDQNRNIVKSYDYNYSTPLIYYNAAVSKVFTRNNCGSNEAGSSVTYSVPEGKYPANSQQLADNKAQADIDLNGQNYANANGVCTPVPYITGSGSGYRGQDYSFRLNNGSPGDSYEWTVPVNVASILGGQGTADLIVFLKSGGGTNPITYQVSVKITSSTGSIKTVSFTAKSLFCGNCPL